MTNRDRAARSQIGIEKKSKILYSARRCTASQVHMLGVSPMPLHRLMTLAVAAWLFCLHSSIAVGVEAREAFEKLLAAPLKLSSSEDSTAKRFRCSIILRMAGTSVLVLVERYDAEMTIIMARPDGTPIAILQNDEFAAFETLPTPGWRFMSGARVGFKINADLESFSWKWSTSQAEDKATPQCDIDVGSLLRWVHQAGNQFSWRNGESELFIRTDTGIVTLERSLSTGVEFPISRLFAFGNSYLLSMRFDTTAGKRRLSTIKLSDAAKFLQTEMQPLTQKWIDQSQQQGPVKFSGEARRKAWQILTVMQIPFAELVQTPHEQMLCAGCNIRLRTGEEGVTRFCIDRLAIDNTSSIIHEKEGGLKTGRRAVAGSTFTSRHRFRIECDGPQTAVVMQTDAGDPVALCRENWILVLDPDRGWLLHPGVITTATDDLLPRSGPGALGLAWKQDAGPATSSINHKFTILSALLEVDWKSGKSPSSIVACHPAYELCAELTLGDPSAEFALTSVRIDATKHVDEFHISFGEKATPLWTELTRDAIIAALHPIEEPLGEKRQSQVQILQQGLTSAQRAKSRELRALVEKLDAELTAPTPAAPAVPTNFKRLP